MKEIEKARMGIITVLAVMLVSITRRLPEARKLSSGITTLTLAGIVLLVAAGSASADTPITGCNFDAGTDGEYYYLTGDLDCSGSESGVIIGANNVIIDGKGYKLNGSSVGAICDDGSETIPCVAHSGVVNNGGWDNVVVKNLEIENFCTGVTMGAQGAPVENMTVEKCKIHDCGDNTNPSPPVGVTHGIHLSNANNCTITKNEIFNQTGSETMADCGSGGNGIAMYGGAGGDYNTVTCNYLHDNGKCGLHAKKGCMWNDISYNRATENTGAGIMPECKQSDYNTFEYNNMSGNGFGGFYICGDDNTIRYNTANGNGHGLPGGHGFQIVAGTKMGTPYGQYNEVTNNSFIGNSGNDVDITQDQYGLTNTVDDMTCDNGNNATYCDDWSSNNPAPVYYDFDSDTYYSDATCICAIAGNGECACCNPGIFNSTHAGLLNTTAHPTNGLNLCWLNAGSDPNDCDAGITSAKPDLIVDSLGITWHNVGAKQYNVTYVVKNDGIANAGISWVNITNSTGEVLKVPTIALSAGASESQQEVGPFTLNGNSEQIIVCADFNNTVIGEQDETNNCEPYTVNYPVVNVGVVPPAGCVNGQFVVNINVSGNGQPVYGVQYKIKYEKNVIRLLTQNKGDFLGSNVYISDNTIDNPHGFATYGISMTEASGLGNAGSGTLAVLTFTTVGNPEAESILNLSEVVVSDNNAIELTNLPENDSVKICDANVAPVAVGKSDHKYNNVGTVYKCDAVLNGTESYDTAPGCIIDWIWNPGDGGAQLYGAIVKHVYGSYQWNASGDRYDPFKAILTVQDDDGATDDDQVNGTVNVAIAGDANADGTVNILDASMVGLRWKKECSDYCGSGKAWGMNDAPPHPEADMADRADLNNDCKANILDASIVGLCWGNNAV